MQKIKLSKQALKNKPLNRYGAYIGARHSYNCFYVCFAYTRAQARALIAAYLWQQVAAKHGGKLMLWQLTPKQAKKIYTQWVKQQAPLIINPHI